VVLGDGCPAEVDDERDSGGGVVHEDLVEELADLAEAERMAAVTPDGTGEDARHEQRLGKHGRRHVVVTRPEKSPVFVAWCMVLFSFFLARRRRRRRRSPGSLGCGRHCVCYAVF
jgi:hypothetical protein